MQITTLFYIKLLGYALIIAFVAVLDATVISTLPYGLFRIHLLPLTLVFVVLLSNIRVAAWWALLGGLVLELFSFRSFGMYLALSWVSLAVIAFLFEKVVTNRSLYSVALISGAVTIIFDILFLVFDYWNGIVFRPFSQLALSFIFSLGINIAVAIAIFYISNFATRRLRPVFLFHR